ncbi:MAG: metallophosphoesterase [Treponema sp.]|nr:metallophosphoesterase [Treponema sp.]
MVKILTKFYICSLVISALFFCGCNIDFLGFIVSNDLDERLLEKDNFIFLDGKKSDGTTRNWRNLNLDTHDNYSFIVLTDTHIEGDKAYGFERLYQKITPDIKFAAVLGDITQNGAAADLETFIKIADSLGIPCYPVIGNHDVYFTNWPEWKTRIGSTNYRIDSVDKNTTLLFLDSANSFFGQKQLDWLETQLKNTGENVFVFTHSPLFVKGPASMQQITDYRERSRIVSMLRNRCDIMFTGHSHKHLENETGNVRYVNIEDFKSSQVYCVVTVNGSSITYKFEKL